MAVYSDFASWLAALGGSFGRASSATRVNSSGLLESASSNVLRYDYDPITLASKGILLEGARTNICLYSGDLQTTAEAGSSRPWVRSGTTLVLNATTGTDGAATAQKIVESADGSAVAHDRHQSFTVGAGTKYAVKVRLKAAERTQAQIQLYDGGSVNQYPIVNLSAGAVVASNGASVTTTQWANGWWEFSFAVTPGTTAGLAGGSFVALDFSRWLGVQYVKVRSGTARLAGQSGRRSRPHPGPRTLRDRPWP